MELPKELINKLGPGKPTFTVERQKALPTFSHGRKGTCWLPLQQLEAPKTKNTGDALRISVPADKDSKRFVMRVRTTCTKWAKQHNVKFTVRLVDGDVCVWRVA